MSLVYYLNDYGPVTATITDVDGETPILPLSGTATIVNQHTGDVIVSDASCQVASGSITYLIPDGSPLTTTSARYVAFLTAEIDSTTKTTLAVPFDVLDKASSLVVDRWRRKVEFSAPPNAPDGSDPLSDEEGRDWVDQAVGLINRYKDTGYTSTLAAITPSPTANDIEFIATVASLMARTAWWAGKGDWTDDEMAMRTNPFTVEWNRIFAILRANDGDEWWEESLDGSTFQFNNYNRDKVYGPGIKYDSTDYWYPYDRYPPE